MTRGSICHMAYRIRLAAAEDIPILVRHRVNMFEKMQLRIDSAAVAGAFRTWLEDRLEAETYVGWLAVTTEGTGVAGGGITILPWPPGPRELPGTLPIVYNVYTEPDHRRRGLARALMETIHAWCRV